MPAHITFNVDEDLKRKFDRKLKKVRVTQTKAFTDFMRCVVTGTIEISNGVIVH